MTDYSALVNVLYEHYGTWQGVADACGNRYSATLYWKIAKKRIRKPGVLVRRGIMDVCLNLPASILPPVTWLSGKRARKNVSFSTDLYRQMVTLKNARGETWEQFGNAALEARMEKG